MADDDTAALLDVIGHGADILGVIARQQSHLDLGYLRAWADALQVRTELEQALVDAQSGPP